MQLPMGTAQLCTPSLKRTTRPTPGKASRRRRQNRRVPFESRPRHDHGRLRISTTMTTRPMNTDHQTTPAGFIPALRFHALTRLYDPVVRLTTRELTIKKRLVGGLGQGVQSVLDLGSGTGTLLNLVRSAYPEAKLVGLDADPRIIALARAKVQNDVDLVHGDATNPPFAPESFDRVVSSLVLHHLTRQQKLRALSAARALLKDGGELHIADWSSPHDVVMRGMFLVVRMLDGFETTRDNVRGDLPDLIREAGFGDVVETYRQRTPFGSMAIYRGRLGVAEGAEK